MSSSEGGRCVTSRRVERSKRRSFSGWTDQKISLMIGRKQLTRHNEYKIPRRGPSSRIRVRMSQSEGLDMKTFNFFIFFISFAMTSGQEKDFSEKNNPPIFQTSETFREPESSSAAKAAEKAFKIPKQQRPEANQSPFPQPKFPTNRPDTIPHLGFSHNPTRTIYLTDHTGHYDLRLQNFARGRPSDFQAALGAISAHILNQKNNREYIPYPPNGNHYNYYRRRAFGAEPPATGAYETGSRSDYDVPAEVDHRVDSSGGEYRPGVPGESFYGRYFDQEAPRPFFGY